MPELIKPTCETCAYWRSDGDRAPNVPRPGNCRRRALITTAGWPTSFHNDWCGEHPAFSVYLDAQPHYFLIQHAAPAPMLNTLADMRCPLCFRAVGGYQVGGAAQQVYTVQHEHDGARCAGSDQPCYQPGTKRL